MRELKFLLTLWKTNIQSAMEYRVAFISQMVGMMLNNAVYFVFWVIFFERFEQVRGWVLSDMFLLFGVAAASFGLAAFLFGNAFNLSETITRGRLDYYLSLPRPVLLHAISSRTIASGSGDFVYGTLSYLFSGQFSPAGLARFIFGTLLATVVVVSFLVMVQSLAFWMGSSTGFSSIAVNAMITFAVYPISLFEGSSRLILFTIIPAAFMGAVPAEFVRRFTWTTLGELLLAAGILLALSITTFYAGLRRYESGSAIQIEV